ncbi:MAG: hypothetical protein GX905_04185, partial [Bacteroidales bacterium]|nr:hypothetical protein [Bacteroidales bacterium]
MNIGKYIELFVDWLSRVGAPIFRQITIMIENTVDVLQETLIAIPFFIVIALFALGSFFIKNKSFSKFQITTKNWRFY